MKAKLSVAALLLATGSFLAFAAGKVESCADKYKACKDTCENQFYKCKSGQSDPAQCENKRQKCISECDKAKTECENAAKGGNAKSSPTPGKKK